MDQNTFDEAGFHKRTWRDLARDWVPAVASLLLALAIVQLAMVAGLNAAALFDASSDYGAPGAHPPGHFETLAAERLAAYFFAFQATIVALTLVAACLVPVLRLRALALAYPRGGLAAIALAVVGQQARDILAAQRERDEHSNDDRDVAHSAAPAMSD